MKLVIKDIVYHLPRRRLTNDDLQRENPNWDLKRLEAHAGVFQRYIADESETALDLAEVACRQLLARDPDLGDRVDAIIFCTQSPDYILPPNACVLHQRLALREEVMAFDINLACSGFVYGLAVAAGLLQAGMASQILLVTADTYSKYIHPQDRSARMVFGDGAAVTWLAASPLSSVGLIDVMCATQGRYFSAFLIPAGGARQPRSQTTQIEAVDAHGNIHTAEQIQMDGLRMVELALSRVPAQINSLLQRNHLTVEDIDLFIFHQANAFVFAGLAQRLKIPSEKIFTNIASVGNTVSASIPMALADARASGVLKNGQLLILSGFGLGFSWATALIKF